MTNERAIELLHRISDSQFDGIHGDERREALSMAVMALEKNLGNNGFICTKTRANDEDRTTGDTIYRQDAIDAVAKWFYDVVNIKESDGTATIFKRLRELSSAQPETYDKRTETHACDLINRQQAIDAVVSAMIDGADAELVEGVMELLPSAQPQWIPCSERLPEHNQQILAYYADIDRIMLISFNTYGIMTMTAWMPLPKPYGGESDED